MSQFNDSLIPGILLILVKLRLPHRQNQEPSSPWPTPFSAPGLGSDLTEANPAPFPVTG